MKVLKVFSLVVGLVLITVLGAGGLSASGSSNTTCIRCDVNRDGVINVVDLASVARSLGQTVVHVEQSWSLKGNRGTDPSINFLGTTDGQPLVIVTSGDEAFRVSESGNVGIGTAQSQHKLEVISEESSTPLVLKSRSSDNGSLLFQMGAQANSENTIVSLTGEGSGSKNFAIVGHNLGNVDRIKLAADSTFITGKVVIGTGDPTEKLSVSGAISTDGNPVGLKWKVFSGTIDGDGITEITHNLTASKITGVVGSFFDGTEYVPQIYDVGSPTRIRVTSEIIRVSNYSSFYHDNPYLLSVFYIG